MLKRAYGTAFPSSAPDCTPISPHSIVAPSSSSSRFKPTRRSMQSFSAPPSLRFPHVPGQWPADNELIADHGETSPSHRSTFFTTVWKWVTDIPSLFSQPHGLARRFLRQQKIAVVPVFNVDGSYKKRLVDAGTTNELKERSHLPQKRANAIHSASYRATREVGLDKRSQGGDFRQTQGFRGIETTVAESHEDGNQDFVLNLNSVPNSFQQSSTHSSVWSPLSKLHIRSHYREGFRDRHVRNETISAKNSSDSPPPSRSLAHQPSETVMRHRLLKLQLRTPKTIRPTQIGTSEMGVDSMTYSKSGNPPSNMPGTPTSSTRFITPSSSSPAEVEPLPSESRVDSIQSFGRQSSPVTLHEEDLSFLLRGHSTPLRKSRRAQLGGEKSYYFDEEAGEILDAIIERVSSNSRKGSRIACKEHNYTGRGKEQDILRSLSCIRKDHGNLRDDQIEAKDNFHDVSKHTLTRSDNPIDELLFSHELLETLQDHLRERLALASPPITPLKPLIAPLSSEEAEKLESVAKNTNYGRNSSFSIVPDKLDARDFGTLLPDRFNGDLKAWLNDNIVNEYLAILIGHKKKKAGFEHTKGGPAPPVHAFSSFWYSTVVSRPKSVERWASRVQLGGRQYLDAEVVLYPICDGGHWRLLVVKPKERKIEYLDSLDCNGHRYIQTFKAYMEKELSDAWIEEEWMIAQQQRSSRQLNGSDCGVFTLVNALAVLREEEPQRVEACCGMMDARERIATTLMARQPTTEWD